MPILSGDEEAGIFAASRSPSDGERINLAAMNSGVGIVTGPGQDNWDISIQKMFPIHEDRSLLFRAEFFNAFNHPQEVSLNIGRDPRYMLTDIQKARDAGIHPIPRPF